MARLLALVDGSVYSQSVCEHAAWIAGRTGAAIELMHVIGRRETASVPSDLSGSIALGARSALLQELAALDEQRAKLAQRRGRAIVDDAKAAIEAAGVGSVTVKLRSGDLVEAVAEHEGEADMLVIGKRGEAVDFARLHLGSNLERVVRSSRKPVFVAARAFRPIRRFLIAYDGGPSSTRAVEHVARSTLVGGLDGRLLMVGTEDAEARRRVGEAEALLRAGGISVSADIRQGNPEGVISKAVEAEGIDLLVMGAYGHSRIRSLIIGSTTTEMIRSCKIPVVLFR